jgi:demethylmenaquinone methyltransferase / 2-methoxy-6-polyprenyl-1,4-benzoquinol methylase
MTENTANPPNSERTHFGFKEVPTQDKAKLVREVFSSVAGKYDVMNDLMSAGLHRLWKRHFVGISGVKPGDQVLDLAGGTGDISKLMAARVGAQGLVVLSDINADMLQHGRDRMLNESAFGRIRCMQINAEAIPFAPRSFDLVTIAFGLRNVTDKAQALREMRRVTKIGGRVMVLEFSELKFEALKPLYDAYSFKVLPRIGQWVANDAQSYQYLAESIRKHPNQNQLAQMMLEADFAEVSVQNLLGGMVAIHSGYAV